MISLVAFYSLKLVRQSLLVRQRHHLSIEWKCQYEAVLVHTFFSPQPLVVTLTANLGTFFSVSPGILILCAGVILHNWPLAASNRIISEKIALSHNFGKRISFVKCTVTQTQCTCDNFLKKIQQHLLATWQHSKWRRILVLHDFLSFKSFCICAKKQIED